MYKKKLWIPDFNLDDGTEPAGVSHIADADGPIVLSDPVCWAAHLCLDLTSLPLHPGCILLSADLQAPGAQCSPSLNTVPCLVNLLIDSILHFPKSRIKLLDGNSLLMSQA